MNEPTYHEPAIYYSFVFDAGVEAPSPLAAVKLLDTDLGITSSLWGTDAVLFARRFKRLELLLQTLDELAEVEASIQREPRRSLLRWAMAHPIEFTRAIRRDRPHEANIEDDESHSVASRRSELKGFLAARMANAQFLQAVARLNDDRLYRAAYLSRAPFVRVDLQPARLQLEDRRIALDVMVLVHRTGVCVLTYFCQFSGDVSHDDLVKWSISSQMRVTEATLPACLHVELARESGIHPSDIPGERELRDVEWITQTDLDWSIVDVFSLYSTFIVSVLRTGVPNALLHPPTDGWLSYPIVILREASPPLDECFQRGNMPNRWLDELLLRSRDIADFRDDFLLATEDSDLSRVTKMALFVQSSHAVLVYGGDWWRNLPRQQGKLPAVNAWIARDLSLTTPLEHLLLQRWILEVAEERLSTGVRTFAELRRVRKSVGWVLEELAGVAPVQYGSLQDEIDQGRRIFAIDRHLRSLDDKLRWVEGVLAASEMEARERRGRRLAQLSVVVTVVLALPAILEVVAFLQSWERVGADAYWGLGGVVDWVTSAARRRPIVSTLAIYGIVLAIVVASIMSRKRARRRSMRLPEAYVWPEPPLQVMGDDSPA